MLNLKKKTYLCIKETYMKKIYLLLSISLIFISLSLQAQTKQYKVRTVAFYNVENLFDTINDPKKFDDERTPEGKDHWTSANYFDHIHKIASTIAKIGRDVTSTAPDFVGLSEVENRSVVEDLAHSEALKDYNYGIVHYDSPDARGIDVAFMYKKDVFTPTHTSKHFLDIKDPSTGKPRYTRDQILVSGQMEGEELHFIINHWPSRSGGEAASRPFREAAAALNKHIFDSLTAINPKAKVISMGDFNDDPTNSAFKKVLKTKANKEKVNQGDLYNPMENLFKKGVGTLAYRDSWSLFDQFVLTYGYIGKQVEGYKYWKAGVFNSPELANPSGRFAGYPFRSYANGSYTGGYSDHFPVYLFLIKLSE